MDPSEDTVPSSVQLPEIGHNMPLVISQGVEPVTRRPSAIPSFCNRTGLPYPLRPAGFAVAARLLLLKHLDDSIAPVSRFMSSARCNESVCEKSTQRPMVGRKPGRPNP